MPFGQGWLDISLDSTLTLFSRGLQSSWLKWSSHIDAVQPRVVWLLLSCCLSFLLKIICQLMILLLSVKMVDFVWHWWFSSTLFFLTLIVQSSWCQTLSFMFMFQWENNRWVNICLESEHLHWDSVLSLIICLIYQLWFEVVGLTVKSRTHLILSYIYVFHALLSWWCKKKTGRVSPHQSRKKAINAI